ncbi:dynein regulatory complex subunit 4 [Chrysoperla carnea]|uniref:dynein regulatory complex subunit 4 n=1 Tax=Chrysoperla carnea TaxID=189513 RepID=UPI001D072E56|nr:dynein regulatory complex subunit 4 [Chrysoperla carnea]
MTREQLEAFALRLKEETDREREERNYFQLERDKLRTYWELTKDQLDEARAQLRNMDREMEEGRERNADEIKLFKQQIKHLSYEQQNNIAELRAAEMVNLKLAQDDHYAQENQLQQDKTDLKNKLIEQQLTFEENLNIQKLNHAKELSSVRGEFELYAKELELKYDKKFGELRYDLGLKHRMEMAEVEERKSRQITELMENHERDFSELKNYYNDITLNNLALIASLKEQIDVQVDQLSRINKQLADTNAENKKLVGPLRQAEHEARDLRHKMQNYEKDKQSLKNTKILLAQIQKQHEDLKWEYETLDLRFQQLKEERDTLKNKFITAILDLQQKTGLKNALLQKRLEHLVDSLEVRDAMLVDITKTCNLPPTEVNNRVEQMLKDKNNLIQDLQYELARVCKMHDDLLRTYEAKLQQFGIAKEELGFTPLRASKTAPANVENLGQGPAGLVCQNIK